jgi:hypothetical protein
MLPCYSSAVCQSPVSEPSIVKRGQMPQKSATRSSHRPIARLIPFTAVSAPRGSVPHRPANPARGTTRRATICRPLPGLHRIHVSGQPEDQSFRTRHSHPGRHALVAAYQFGLRLQPRNRRYHHRAEPGYPRAAEPVRSTDTCGIDSRRPPPYQLCSSPAVQLRDPDLHRGSRVSLSPLQALYALYPAFLRNHQPTGSCGKSGSPRHPARATAARRPRRASRRA